MAKRMKVLLVLVLGGFAAIAGSSLPGPATADNWFGATGSINHCGQYGNRTDAEPLSFTYFDTTTPVENAAEMVRTQLLEPPASHLNTNPPAAQSSATDVVVLDQYYSTYCGIAWTIRNAAGQIIGVTDGMTMCRSLTANNRCQSADVRINLTSFDLVRTTAKLRRSTLCHEIGHAIGLRHRTGPTVGCMEALNTSVPQYTPHDLGEHINQAF